MEDVFKLLQDISHTQVPPHLLEQIQKRIQAEDRNRIPLKTVYSIAASFILLVTINAVAITHYNNTKHEKTNVVQAFQLMPNNNLYR